MVSYSFRPRFVAPIQAGTKRQTIRAVRTGRSRHARPGEELQLYTGMRTRQCKLIGKAICKMVTPISIHIPEGMIKLTAPEGTCFDGVAPQGMVTQLILQRQQLDDFAALDGFRDWSDMREFWMDTHDADEFEGVMITWERLL